jgi:hypothetical protein
VSERINTYGYMLWMMVLAVVLMLSGRHGPEE